jgi:hypothetical protein
MSEPHRTITINETRAVPRDSLLLGGAAMAPFPVGAALAVAGGSTGAAAATLTVLWGGAILAFLAGVRRGVSFRTPGGLGLAELALMLWLYLLAAGALAVIALALGTPSLPPVAIAAGLLAAGFATILVADPVAAARGTMPLHFARLRPVQMAVPTLSLALIAATA